MQATLASIALPPSQTNSPSVQQPSRYLSYFLYIHGPNASSYWLVCRTIIHHVLEMTFFKVDSSMLILAWDTKTEVIIAWSLIDSE